MLPVQAEDNTAVVSLSLDDTTWDWCLYKVLPVENHELNWNLKTDRCVFYDLARKFKIFRRFRDENLMQVHENQVSENVKNRQIDWQKTKPVMDTFFLNISKYLQPKFLLSKL